jgi:pimeloyl-ACP methyl ester carboxylesterase
MYATLPIGRPSLALFGIEPFRAAFEFASRQVAPGRTAAAPGDGHPVIIFPGLGTDGSAVAPLRRHCKSLGYEALDWGRGFNLGPQGDIDVWLAELKAHTVELLRGFDQSATLIGWSLGGIYARELSKTMGRRVRQVITLGTPFNANADHTNVGWIFRLLSGGAPPYTAAFSARLRSAPAVPTTSIYSRSDGIVAWQTCRHVLETHRIQDLEVPGSHIGLAWNPAVLHVVGDRLAQAPGRWQRYAADNAGAAPP